MRGARRASRRRRTAFVLALLAAGSVAAVWAAGSIMTRGAGAVVRTPDPPAVELAIPTVDGVVLAATYRRGPVERGPAVLLLHGLGASREAVDGNAAWLAGQGYATLAIDFRGHGESTRRTRSFGLHEARDASAAFHWLKRRRHGAPVAVIGVSLGGAAALLGPAGPLPADALVLQAVYPDIRSAIRNRLASRMPRPMAALVEPLLSHQSRLRFGVLPDALSPLQALRRYPGPVLVIGGLEDRATLAEETRAMAARPGGQAQLWLVPTGGHAEISSLETGEYRRRLARFLARAIGVPASVPPL